MFWAQFSTFGKTLLAIFCYRIDLTKYTVMMEVVLTLFIEENMPEG